MDTDRSGQQDEREVEPAVLLVHPSPTTSETTNVRSPAGTQPTPEERD
jgi:hypothetical protein